MTETKIRRTQLRPPAARGNGSGPRAADPANPYNRNPRGGKIKWTRATAPRHQKGHGAGTPHIRHIPAPPPWRKGQSGNSKGKPWGAKTLNTAMKVRIMARSGMLPLDFFTAVFRDELYDRYTQHVAEDGVTLYFTPAKGAQKIEVKLDQRINAAHGAAPYVHRRQPVGVELGDRTVRFLTAEKLARLPSADLAALLRLMDRLGVELDPADVAGVGARKSSGAVYAQAPALPPPPS